MKALITGRNGTLGKALITAAKRRRWEVVGWDREKVGTEVYAEMEAFVRDINPDVLYHLAIPSQVSGRENEGWHVNYQWTSELAWICRQLNVRFIYTSTVMVFSNDAVGPFTVDSYPNAAEGYGFEKRSA